MRWLKRWIATPVLWVWPHIAAVAVWFWRHTALWVWRHTAVWIWKHAAARMTGIAVVLLGGAVAGTFGLHSVLDKSGSTDAWAAAIEAVAAAVLVLVTTWYVYLTFSLLEAQRAAPRQARWEAGFGDLGRYVIETAWEIWPILESAPIEVSHAANAEEITARGKTLSEIGAKLIKLVPQLPLADMVKVLDVSAAVTAASDEQLNMSIAIGEAMIDAGGQVMWDEAQRRHEESSRPGAWDDMLADTAILAATTKWLELSHKVGNELTI